MFTKKKYRTQPLKTSGLPPGIPNIIVNEAAERFSFYGMRAVLVVFMTSHLMDKHGNLAVMSEEDAKFWFHQFAGTVYFFPLLGGLLADAFLGKYRTIISLSLVYCGGHLALALDHTRVGLLMGLSLIAIGSGGIKSCVTAHVGDQFGRENQHLREKIFNWFYFSINFGAFFSMLLTPWLLENKGPHWSFGVPGILMGIATLIFWMGRKKFTHIQPGGMGFLREIRSKEGVTALGKLAVIYVFVAMFWALYDQTGSSWVLQAQKMDLHFAGRTWLPSQVQAVNPILILILAPVFTYGVYPVLQKIFRVTPLRKIGMGFVLTVVTFLISAYIQHRITLGVRPNIGWQLLAYVVLTSAEVMVSITCLDFSYSQAPKKMKSVIFGVFLASVWLGNQFTAIVNWFIQNPDGTSKLAGALYYLFFAGAMFVALLIYIPVAWRFKERNYIQGEDDENAPVANGVTTT